VAGLANPPSFYRLHQHVVRVTASVTVATKVQLDVVTKERYASRSAAINEAICLWLIREETRMTREQRAKIRRLYEQADDWAPIDQLLAAAQSSPD
jgi:Arc/MetJ-type ribon-helix-helix transcriptional regulator